MGWEMECVSEKWMLLKYITGMYAILKKQSHYSKKKNQMKCRRSIVPKIGKPEHSLGPMNGRSVSSREEMYDMEP